MEWKTLAGGWVLIFGHDPNFMTILIFGENSDKEFTEISKLVILLHMIANNSQ